MVCPFRAKKSLNLSLVSWYLIEKQYPRGNYPSWRPVRVTMCVLVDGACVGGVGDVGGVGWKLPEFSDKLTSLL